MTNLRTLLWIYLVLLIFEGALRKWIVPALDAPLLIIRDPLVIWIYIIAAQRGYMFRNAFFMPNLILAICAGLLGLLFGEGNIAVTIYGLRTDFLQIPLIFLIPQILDRSDVIKMGRFILFAAVPVALVAILQFKSPQASFINKGALYTHYGTVRPSGPFSFVAGLVAFDALVASFLFYAFVVQGTYRIWLITATTIALILMAGVSGSRSCLLSIGIVAIAAVLCVAVRGKGGGGLIVAALVIILLLPILSTLKVFKDGANQLTKRFHDAGSAEQTAQTGGIVERYFSTIVDPLEEMGDVPIFGHGVGIGTNAAAGMLHGRRSFSLAKEDEWNRIIYECGPIIGFLICLFRLALTLAVGKSAYDAFREGNMLPMLIYASCAISLFNGQWGVPTSLGFGIFGGGLVLAACVDPEEDEDDDEDDEDEHEDVGEEEDESSTTEAAS